MLGAIIGDIIGSFYERNNVKTKDFDLFPKEATFTDDTVMTLAVAKWLVEDKSHTEAGLVKIMQELGRKYLNAGYGGHFYEWILSDDPLPYNSWGNGAAMRVSPVGLYAKSLEETLMLAKISANVTHNHPEGIRGAQAIAAAVFLNRTDYSQLKVRQNNIKNYIQHTFGYNLDRSLDDIRATYKFDVSCQGSVPEAIIAFLESKNLQDCVRNAISIGGDSDTIAAIACSIFAAGVDCFSDAEPESCLIATRCKSYLDDYLLNIDSEFEKVLPFYIEKAWENESHYSNHRNSNDPDCLPDGTLIYYDREQRNLAFKIENVKEKKPSYIIYNATVIDDYGDFPPHFCPIEVVELFLTGKDARYFDGHTRVSYCVENDCSEFFDFILEDSKLSVRQMFEFYNDEYGISRNFVRANKTYYYIVTHGNVGSPWQHFGSNMRVESVSKHSTASIIPPRQEDCPNPTTTTIICSKCGWSCNADYLYCPKCGRKLGEESKVTPKWVNWCVRVVLLMIIWYISYLISHK